MPSRRRTSGPVRPGGYNQYQSPTSSVAALMRLTAPTWTVDEDGSKSCGDTPELRLTGSRRRGSPQ